jgi:site-specific recombinase XerD
VESFFTRLREEGYAKKTLRKKRPVVRSFAEWMSREGVTVEDLDESYVARFLGRGRRRRCRYRRGLERGTLRLLLRHLRAEGAAPAVALAQDACPASQLEGEYVAYLRRERGLTETSVLVYKPFVHDLLTTIGDESGFLEATALSAVSVRDFLIQRLHGRSGEYARLLAVAMRSFLRFLFFNGDTKVDLSLTVPSARRTRVAGVHPYLTVNEVDRILATPNRATPNGSRDYAILLLLARLGLRAGEVVAMELGDIQWRTGELIVRGKGRRLDRLPLLSDVGEALAQYIRRHRRRCSSRRVFLRAIAPDAGLAGPAAVGGVVRAALARAAVRRPTGRGAAHLFRHSLATTMVREGASLGEVAEVLRHQSISTTEIYAKVAFDALRSVARRWPVAGGGVR